MHKKINIAIISDCISDFFFLKKIEKFSYKIYSNPVDFIHFYYSINNPHQIIINYDLEPVNGIEFIKILKKLEIDIPFILVEKSNCIVKSKEACKLGALLVTDSFLHASSFHLLNNLSIK